MSVSEPSRRSIGAIPGTHSFEAAASAVDPNVYPESDGQPMAENEVQLFLMLALIAHLRSKLGGPDAHVGGDMFWYPVRGQPSIVRAPDVFVAFGRPQEPKRRSWKSWEEDDHPLDFVLEVVSPSNSWYELARLLLFYERHGVREYVVVDSERGTVEVFRRSENALVPVPDADGVSELTRIRLVAVDAGIDVIDLDLGRVLEPHELRALADSERDRADAERDRADAERRRADLAEDRVQALEARLRAAGSGPNG
jgi:Uma2 family endonuclease